MRSHDIATKTILPFHNDSLYHEASKSYICNLHSGNIPHVIVKAQCVRKIQHERGMSKHLYGAGH